MKIGTASSVQIVHQTVDIDVAYDSFTHNFEKILGKFDLALAASFANDPSLMDEAIKKMEGEQNLMIFGSLNHGVGFRLIGEQPRKAIRYTMGNPRVAIQMTRHDIRAGLYVPFNVLIYEVSENTIRIEFDRPSSLLGTFENADVDKVAEELDVKLEKVIEKAAHLSRP
ncbi:MAG TPA: DUF302 domain-containing protein [Paraburkholderia sp.]